MVAEYSFKLVCPISDNPRVMRVHSFPVFSCGKWENHCSKWIFFFQICIYFFQSKKFNSEFNTTKEQLNFKSDQFSVVEKRLEIVWKWKILVFAIALGPSHVLWEVSFGFWVTWTISSWQENYKSVFFPNLQFLYDKLQLYPKKLFVTLAKLFWSIYHSKVSKLKK